ncbi:MAG: alanine racemase, partial [Thermoanaerobaculia bacterium]
MKGLRPTRAVVDLDALARNFHTLSGRVAPDCAVMPVVKADGYGHGAGVVARRLQREGATSFAVAVVEEAAELRRDGVAGEILVMGWIGQDQLPDLIRHGLVANAHSLELLAELAAFSEARRTVLPLHLKLDTGMTRLGLLPADLPDAIALLQRSAFLRVEGAFQNFASADDEADGQSVAQIDCFAEMVRALELGGVRVPMVHVANSAGTLASPRWPASLPPPARVRPGL